MVRVLDGRRAASGPRPKRRSSSTRSCAGRGSGPLYRPDVTLQELVDAFLEQYQGAPSSKDRLDQYLGKATAKFGDRPMSTINALDISRWRASLPEKMRHGALRSLRQALGA